VRHELCNLIAEMTAPLADATLAHYLLFVLTLGRDLTPPSAAGGLAFCASFDARHGILRQRFSGENETAPLDPSKIAAGMTLVCEPVETGYYRIPDDERHRSAAGLLMSDDVYQWSLRALLMFYDLKDAIDQLGAGQREAAMQVDRQMKGFFFRLWMKMRQDADTANRASASPAAPEAAQERADEHRAAGQMLERAKDQSHRSAPHAHPENAELQPE
jgi:hypothetical protein